MTRVTVRLTRSLPEGAEIEAVLPDSLEELEARFAQAEPLAPGARSSQGTGKLEGSSDD